MHFVHHICTAPSEWDPQVNDYPLELPLIFGPMETANRSSNTPESFSRAPSSVLHSTLQPAYHISSENPISWPSLGGVFGDDGSRWPLSGMVGSVTPASNMTLKGNLLKGTQRAYWVIFASVISHLPLGAKRLCVNTS